VVRRQRRHHLVRLRLRGRARPAPAPLRQGTHKQWIGSDRIDWSTEIDPDNPTGLPDEFIAIYGTPWWDKMSDAEKGELRRHHGAWRFSQFMHGEQGALMCAAKIVQTVPDLDSKFYAVTQTIDEARHVEVYGRYSHDKIGLVYPLNPNLRSLLDDVISDSRWVRTVSPGLLASGGAGAWVSQVVGDNGGSGDLGPSPGAILPTHDRSANNLGRATRKSSDVSDNRRRWASICDRWVL
jgi:P-aminobenzoate N-oxygenase AurF